MSYYRDIEKFENGLPSIRARGSGLVEHITITTPRSSRIHTVDDSVLYTRSSGNHANHVRFASSAGGHSLATRIDSPVFYPTSNSRVVELENEVRMLRDELGKKEKLIIQLSSMESNAPPPRVDFIKIHESYDSERANALANARSEIAALELKIEGLHSQLYETRTSVDARENKIKALQVGLEMAKENEAKQISIVSSLTKQVVESEGRFSSMEGAAGRGEHAVITLQEQLQEANHRILDLENRVSLHSSEKESIRSQLISWEQKYTLITSKLTTIFSLDGIIDVDAIVVKITDMTQENACLRAKIYSMKEYVNNAEVETKACRETIMRLVTEAEKEQKSATKYSLELDSLRLERDSAVAKHCELERTVLSLRDQVEVSNRSIYTIRKELEEKETRYLSREAEIRNNSNTVHSYELQIKGLRSQMASLLSIEGHMPLAASDDAIRDRIKAIIMALKEKSTNIEVLEAKVTDYRTQLDRQYDLNKSADSRAKRVEGDYFSMTSKVEKLEYELASADALRDSLRRDKDVYLQFLERLALIFRIDKISVDVGLDTAIEALLSRADYIVKQDSDAYQDKKNTIISLQRKIKSTKEQLESRDLHIDLLRKKVTSMEERLSGKIELDKERESEVMRNKKMQKFIERLKQELHEKGIELNDMKARLFEGSNIKSRSIEQERTLQSLQLKIGELEEVRLKQSKRISSLKDELESRSLEVSSKNESVNSTIHSLSGELRTTKLALDELTAKERQLLDLRQVIARMLGMDVNLLAVPDYEIIARLEKLILAHTSGGIAQVSTVSAITDGLGDGFRAGYEDTGRVIRVNRSRTPTKTVRMVTSKINTTRTRSASPAKKRDNRAY